MRVFGHERDINNPCTQCHSFCRSVRTENEKQRLVGLREFLLYSFIYSAKINSIKSEGEAKM